MHTAGGAKNVSLGILLANEPLSSVTLLSWAARNTSEPNLQNNMLLAGELDNMHTPQVPGHLYSLIGGSFYNNEPFFRCWFDALIFSCHFSPT